MAWTTPRDWSAGELVTAGMANTHWRDNMVHLFDGTNFVGVQPTGKIYLDGGGDSYIVESTTDRIDIYTGGGLTAYFRVAAQTSGVMGNWSLGSTKKLFLDGGGNTYIHEVSADKLDLVAGNAQMLELDQPNAAVSIPAAFKFYLDGGADTYFWQASTNRIKFIAGGTEHLRIDGQSNFVQIASADVFIDVVKKLYFDGGVDTSISEAAADVLRCRSGGSGGVDLTSGATAWVAASDERLKTGFEPITDATRKLGTLRAVTGYFLESEHFDAEAAGRRRVFLIAQDVQKVLPEAVYTDEDGFLGLKYAKTIPLVVAGFNEHTAYIEKLTARVAKLERAVQ